MSYKKLGIFGLILLILLIGASVASAQDSTEAADATVLQPAPVGTPQPAATPVAPQDGEPPRNGQNRPLPPGQPPPSDGQPPPSDGQRPQPPQDGQPPQYPHDGQNGQFPPRRPPQYVAPAATTSTVSTVYPAQVVILRHIEQSIADALGLTRAQVNTFRLSETFDELVAAYGLDTASVRAEAATDLQAWIVDGINDGTITSGRGQLILDNLSSIIDRAFSGEFNVNGATVTGLLNT